MPRAAPTDPTARYHVSGTSGYLDMSREWTSLKPVCEAKRAQAFWNTIHSVLPYHKYVKVRTAGSV